MKELIVFLTLAGLVGGCSKTPEEVQRNLFDQGMASIHKYRFEKADSSFIKLSTDFPNSVEGHYGRGLVLESQFLYYDALRVYLDVTAAEPSFVPARAATARICMRLNRPEHAVGELTLAVALPDCDIATRTELVNSLLTLREFSLAQAALDGAVASGLDEQVARVLTARLQYHRNQEDSALIVSQEALTAGSQRTEFYSYLADLYEDQGLVDSALDFSARAAKAGDADFVYLHTHFLRYLRNKYFFDARRLIKEAERQDGAGLVTSGMWVFYAWAADESRRADAANVKYQLLHSNRISPIIYDMRTRWMLPDILAFRDAQIQVGKFIQSSNISTSFRDFMESEIQSIALQTANLTENIGPMKETKGWAEGRREFRVVDLFHMYRQGQREEFFRLRDSLASEHSDDPVWLTDLANVGSRNGISLYEDAERLYQQALEQDSSFGPALVNWVACLEVRGMVDSACQVMNAHIGLVESAPELSLKQATLKVLTGDLDEAMVLFRKNIVYAPGNMEWFAEFAEALLRQNEAQQALEIVVLATELRPDDADAFSLAAMINADRGNYEVAAEMADKGLSIEEDNVNIAVQRARAMFGRGKSEEAVNEFEGLLKTARGNPEVNLYYSRCLASEGINLRRAQNLGRAAVLHSGGTLQSLLNLAFVYYQSDEFANARAEGQRASRAYPNSAEAFYWLGLAHYKLGEAPAAAVLQKAVDLGLRGEMLASARETLAQLENK